MHHLHVRAEGHVHFKADHAARVFPRFNNSVLSYEWSLKHNVVIQLHTEGGLKPFLRYITMGKCPDVYVETVWT